MLSQTQDPRSRRWSKWSGCFGVPRRAAPDVVLMDIQMPRWMVLKPRAVSWNPTVTIIICTATTDPKRVATTFLQWRWAVACLEKPFAPEHPHHRSSPHLLETSS